MASTFESGPVGCKATPKRQKQGCTLAIVRGQENRSPPPQTLGLAGWPCAAAAITKLGVATPDYCDLLLLAILARKTGALAVQTLRTKALNLSTTLR